MAECSQVRFSCLADRLDAEFYDPVGLTRDAAIMSMDTVRLGDIAKVSDGNHLTIAGSYAEEGVRYLRGKDLTEFFVSDRDPIFITKEKYQTLGRSHIRNGDILVVIVGATSGRVGLVLDRTEQITGSCKLAIVRPLGKSLSSQYIVGYLQSKTGHAELRRMVRGGSQTGIVLPDLKAMRIPVLDTDQRAQVESAITEAATARQQSISHLSKAESLLSEALDLDSFSLPTPAAYTASFQFTAAAGRLDAEHFRPRHLAIRDYLSRNFGGRPLGELGRVMKGKTPQGYVDIGIPVVRSGDLTDLDDTSKLRHMNPSTAHFQLRPGDVLISSIGFGSIGKVDVFDHAGAFTTVSEVTVVRQTVLNPYFLSSFLASHVGQVQIESWITGATGQLHLRPADVEKIIVPTNLGSAIESEIEKAHLAARERKKHAANLLAAASRRVDALIFRQGQHP